MERYTNKVLLINPEETTSKFHSKGIIDDEPLDIEIVYTALKNAGIDCMIYDAMRPQGVTLEMVIKAYEPDYVYLTAIIKEIPIVRGYNSTIKKLDHSIQTVLGGSYVEYNYEEVYQDSIDYICRSLDPKVVVDIVKGEPLHTLNGLCYREDGVWISNDLKYFDINDLEVIDRTYFYQHIEEFRYLELTKIARIRTSYACPFKCKFCYRTMANTGKYVARDIESVVAEIKSLKTDNIYFIDDDFMFNRDRLIKFITLIKKENISKNYVAYGRSDFILQNKDVIKQLKEIGFYYILVGLEAVNDTYLHDYNKLVDVNKNAECVAFLNEIRLNCMGMFIIDMDFRPKDFRALYQWVKVNNLSHVAVSMLTPLPATKLYEEYEGQFITNDLTKWDYIHLVVKPNKMSVSRFYLNYYILVIRLLNEARKNGIYDFIDWSEIRKTFLSLLYGK